MTPAALVLAVALQGEAPIAEPESVQNTPAAQKQPNIVVPAVHALSMMTVMRVTESVIWPNPFSRPEQFGWRYEEAFTKPPVFDAKKPFMQWDGDPWPVNTVGHALFGSELYLRARQCRLGWAGSLAFTAASSAIWEFGFEANGARPSGLDLIYTPVAGILLGEGRFLLHRAASHLSSPVAKSVVRGIVDPFGEIERAVGTDC